MVVNFLYHNNFNFYDKEIKGGKSNRREKIRRRKEIDMNR